MLMVWYSELHAHLYHPVVSLERFSACLHNIAPPVQAPSENSETDSREAIAIVPPIQYCGAQVKERVINKSVRLLHFLK